MIFKDSALGGPLKADGNGLSRRVFSLISIFSTVLLVRREASIGISRRLAFEIPVGGRQLRGIE